MLLQDMAAPKAAEKEDSSWPSASFWWLPTVASDPRLVALWLLSLLCHMSRVSVFILPYEDASLWT